MRKTILLFLFAAGATLLAQGPPPGERGFGPRDRGFGLGRGMGPGHTVVTGHPYSATETTTTTQTLVGGNVITHQQTAQVYRDSQGRVRVERTITPRPGSNESPFTEIVISDPVGGYRYLLNSSTLTAYQMPLPQPRTNSSDTTTPPSPPARPGVTMATTDLGTASVNGVSATGKQVTHTIGAGVIGNQNPIVITRVSYVSTDLQVPVQIKSSDPRFGASDFELTNISTAEPTANLFQIPSNYTIKTGGPRGEFGHGGGPAFRHPPQQ